MSIRFLPEWNAWSRTVSTRRRRNRNDQRLQFETLELRQMLNAAPIANNDPGQLTQGTTPAVDYALLNDTDIDGDTLTITG